MAESKGVVVSRSIRTTWLTLLLTLSLLPLLVAGAILSSKGYSYEQERALQFQQTITRQAVVQLSTFIDTATNEARLIVQTPNFTNATQARQEEVLAQTLFYRNIFDNLALIDAQGAELARTSRLGTVPADQLASRAQDDAFIVPMQRNKPWYGPVFFSSITGEPLLPVSVPVVDADSGKTSGVLVAEIRLRQIFNTVVNIQFGKQGTIEIVDGTGQVVAHRDSRVIMHDHLIDLGRSDGIYHGENGDVLQALLPVTLGDTALYVVTELPISEALSQAYSQIATTLALFLVTVLVATAIGIVAVSWITRPIQALARAAQVISAGDFAQQVLVTSRDEIGTLQREFNQMARSLFDQRQVLAAQTTELQSALAELHDRALAQERLLDENAQQREVIRELSIPVLPVGSGTLVLPLVGTLDTERLIQVQERALAAIEGEHARRLLIDVTGVAMIDTQVAQSLIGTVRAAGLLGAQVALVGIRPEVAQAIIGLGLQLGEVQTFKDLQSALSECTRGGLAKTVSLNHV